ncbi:fumarate hydratase [Pedobacter sp.]|uniref:fumarate hydratase n=1 Tax=Pedobacter sp. TaxID=1411316 RepID=UPI003D7FEC4B
MIKNLFLLLLFVCVITACKRLPNVQGKGEAFLQGVWNQDSIANADKLLSYTQHKFKFTCDSFYVDLTTYSKVNYYADSCFNNGVWKEYAKGVYVVRNDSLFMEGDYTKSNYKQKVSGCFHTGRYVKSFYVKSISPNLIQMESTNDQRDINLALKERIVCEQKPL